jgi:hypothetical protein
VNRERKSALGLIGLVRTLALFACVLPLFACGSPAGSDATDTSTLNAHPTVSSQQRALIARCIKQLGESDVIDQSDVIGQTDIYVTDRDSVGSALLIPTSKTGASPVDLVWMSGYFTGLADSSPSTTNTNAWMVLPVNATRCPTNDDIGVVEKGAESSMDFTKLGEPVRLS